MHAKVEDRAAGDLQWLKEHYGLELDPISSADQDGYYAFSPDTIDQLALRLSDLALLRLRPMTEKGDDSVRSETDE